MTELGIWKPLDPAAAAEVFRTMDAPWWIAGGWAIDAFIGRKTREHGDLDVGILRRDQLKAQAQLALWDLQAADPPGKLRPWRHGETLPLTVQDVWCRPSPESAWGLQLMLDEAEGDEWEYRRNRAVHRPVESLTWQDAKGVPYLAAEVQLLYAAARLSPKHEQDFAACRPLLSAVQAGWLATALRLAHPGHPWIEGLS
ncbi:MAG TPA: amino acid transporter [Dehalococcoidia bacterium]|nr:amino acid transporter [Dehalococcoidia bacterium]